MKRKSAVLFLFLLLLGQCSTEVPDYDDPAVYFSTMQELVVEIAYEPGAEPYVGSTRAIELWSIVLDNLEAIFATRSQPVTVTVPTTLAEMQEIPDQNKSVWTANDVMALASQYRKGTSTQTKGDFFIVFVNGNAAGDDGQADNSVLGFNITGTSVMVMFKEVVAGSSSVALVRKFVEQSTIVHEMGHAFGLVNNGVPMTTSHQDSAHGAHCTNQDCVMYYLNEGAGDLKTFVQNYLISGETVMFGSECLNDTRSYKP